MFHLLIKNVAYEQPVRPIAHFILLTTLVSNLLSSHAVHADAPTDINSNLRAWYDAVDVDANNDYTNNPATGSLIAEWRDKSGSGNHVSGTGTARPAYRHNVFSVSRHGVDFNGSSNILSDTDDIWIGAVDTSEIFFVASTDQVKISFNFASLGSGNNRISSHIPWGNGVTFFDQGPCCGNPARLRGTLPITLNETYLWQYIGLPALQSVIRNGDTMLTDGGAGVYNNVNSQFSLGGRIGSTALHHHGHFYEAIFYQSELNNAQRRILVSYLAAKWDRTLPGGVDFADVYEGDSTANGNYDFFVGGIGRDNGSQSIGTSQGLTITDNNFLTNDNKFVTAGVNYLLSTPASGQTTTDLPTGIVNRSNRTWYVDTTGTGGTVNLTFNAANIGIPAENGRTYVLLHRTGTSGTFSEVARSTMLSGNVNFTLLPDNGVYAIGLIKEIELALEKTVSNESPNVGELVTFTLSLRNDGPDTATNASVSDIVPAGFGNLTAGSAPFPSSISISGNTVDWTNMSVTAAGTVSVTFTAEVLPP